MPDKGGKKNFQIVIEVNKIVAIEMNEIGEIFYADTNTMQFLKLVEVVIKGIVVRYLHLSIHREIFYY